MYVDITKRCVSEMHQVPSDTELLRTAQIQLNLYLINGTTRMSHIKFRKKTQFFNFINYLILEPIRLKQRPVSNVDSANRLILKQFVKLTTRGMHQTPTQVS